MKLFILSVLFDLFDRTYLCTMRWAQRVQVLRCWAWSRCTTENMRRINERTVHITF